MQSLVRALRPLSLVRARAAGCSGGAAWGGAGGWLGGSRAVSSSPAVRGLEEFFETPVEKEGATQTAGVAAAPVMASPAMETAWEISLPPTSRLSH